ncbi:MAG: type VI secretion system tube protein Hcp, partial [Acidimicrobiales bacterium]
TVAGHAGEVVLIGIGAAGGDAGGGPRAPRAMEKALDQASPHLAKAAAEATRIPCIRITQYGRGSAAPIAYFALSDATITSLTVSAGAAGATERLELDFSRASWQIDSGPDRPADRGTWARPAL